jgi:hypothetical protein
MSFWDDVKSVGQNIINPLPTVSRKLFGDDPNNFFNQAADRVSGTDVVYNYATGKNDPWGTAAKNTYGLLPVSGLTSPNDSIWNYGLKPTPDPAPPPGDPRIGQIKQGQNDLYNEFSANKPQIEKSMLRQYQIQAHRDLADQQAQIRRDAASRGIMNSGIRLGSEQKADAQYAGNVASAKSNINSTTDQMERELQAEAADAGFMQQRIASDLNDNIYNQAMKNMASKNAGFSSIGQAGGAAAGSYAANRS